MPPDVFTFLGSCLTWPNLHFTTLCNRDILYWLALGVCLCSSVLNLGNDVHTFDYLAKNDVLAVEMGCASRGGDDEELATVCIGARVLEQLANMT